MKIFASKTERAIWIALFLFFVPLTTVLRFVNLDNPLVEPHPWRQLQTALPIGDFVENGTNLLDYGSPLGKQLWNPIYEFPVYQALVAEYVKATGSSIETASRVLNLAFFMGGLLCGMALIHFFAGTRPLAWFALLYWIIPFNVIFSRVCLIDHCALFFLLAFLFCYLKSQAAQPLVFWCFFFLGLFAGTLASTIKVQVWYVPVFMLGLYLIRECWSKRLKFDRWVCLNLGLLIQLGVAVAWLRWSNGLKSQEGGVLADGAWYFGTWGSRFSLESWSIILKWLFRWILDDWLFIPFLVGIYASWKRPPVSLVLLILTFVPIGVMWNVHLKHDYYLIAYLPFILYLAASGICFLFDARRAVSFGVLVLMAGVLCYRSAKHSLSFEPIFTDYRSQILDAYELAAWTDPKDVVLARGYEGQFRLPFYGKRAVATWHHVRPEKIAPSAYLFANEVETELMRHEKEIWIEGNRPGFLLYRSRAVGKHRWEPRREIAVSSFPAAMKTEGWNGFAKEVKSCLEPLQFRLPKGEFQGLSIRSLETGMRFNLPSKEFLRLPSGSPWGCHFEISLLSTHS